MKKIIEYYIICVDPSYLDSEVQAKLQEGFQPYGHPSAVYAPYYGLKIAQAMVRYED